MTEPNVIVQDGQTIVYTVGDGYVFLNDERIDVPDVMDLSKVCIKDGLLTVGGFYFDTIHKEFIPLTLKALWTYIWNRKKFYRYE